MKLNVLHVAKLANLPLTDEEVKKFEKQLTDILQYMEKLNEVDTKAVEETSQVTGLENVVRSDVVSPSLLQKDVLSTAKAHQQNLFKVKGVLDQE